jgi:hypothetical protein
MRPRTALALILTAASGALAWPLATRARAQGLDRSPYAVRSTEPDLLRPYSSRNGSAPVSGTRAYTRPRPLTTAPTPARASSPPRTVHDYFPGMRPGVSPNRNTVNPRSLCVPGRRALLMMR